MNALTIAAQEVRVGLRNRWVLATTLLMAALALQVAPAAKMATLRALAAAGDLVEDIELRAPGLQELYAQLVGAEQVAR